MISKCTVGLVFEIVKFFFVECECVVLQKIQFYVHDTQRVYGICVYLCVWLGEWINEEEIERKRNNTTTVKACIVAFNVMVVVCTLYFREVDEEKYTTLGITHKKTKRKKSANHSSFCMDFVCVCAWTSYVLLYVYKNCCESNQQWKCSVRFPLQTILHRVVSCRSCVQYIHIDTHTKQLNGHNIQ